MEGSINASALELASFAQLSSLNLSNNAVRQISMSLASGTLNTVFLLRGA